MLCTLWFQYIRFSCGVHMRTNNFRSYNHFLIEETDNSFTEVREWLQTYMKDEWEMERLDVPFTIMKYASVYIKDKSDYFLFKLRWNPVP